MLTFWRHVHGRASYTIDPRPRSRSNTTTAGLTLFGDDFGGTEIDVLDDAVMVEQDVCLRLALC